MLDYTISISIVKLIKKLVVQDYLEKLLDKLDKVYESGQKFCTVSELEKDIPLDLIREAFARDLIRDLRAPQQTKTLGTDKTIPCVLTIKGFEYLNQIRLKKAVEGLNGSICNFNRSSDTAFSKLHDSIKNFNESSDKYSTELVDLTWAIYTFTIIVAGIPIAEKIIKLFNVSPEAEIFWLICFIVIIGCFMIMFHNNYKKITALKVFEYSRVYSIKEIIYLIIGGVLLGMGIVFIILQFIIPRFYCQ